MEDEKLDDLATCERPSGLILGQAPSSKRSTVPLSGIAHRRLCILTGLSRSSLRHFFECRNILPFYPGHNSQDLPPSSFVELATSCSQKAPTTIQSTASKKKGDRFPIQDARANLRWCASQGMFEGRSLIILLGTKVAATLGIRGCRRLFDRAWVRINEVTGLPQPCRNRRECLLIVLPHTSGVSHFWNTQANVSRAKHFAALALEDSGVLRSALGAEGQALFRSSRHFSTCSCGLKTKLWCQKCCLGYSQTSKYFLSAATPGTPMKRRRSAARR